MGYETALGVLLFASQIRLPKLRGRSSDFIADFIDSESTQSPDVIQSGSNRFWGTETPKSSSPST